jgi:hypothetical protein
MRTGMLVGVALLLLGGCWYGPALRLERNSSPPSFQLVPGAQVDYVAVRRIEVRASDDRPLWVAETEVEEKAPEFRFAYGDLPARFKQVIPPAGPPFPLESVSRSAVLTYGPYSNLRLPLKVEDGHLIEDRTDEAYSAPYAQFAPVASATKTR